MKEKHKKGKKGMGLGGEGSEVTLLLLKLVPNCIRKTKTE